MANVKVRYLITKPGRHGPRYVWQPSTRDKRAGDWRDVRLSDDRAAAIAEAEDLNRQLDAWRNGTGDGARPAPQPTDTVAAVIERYRRSERFTRLAACTQRDYRWVHGVLEDWAGDLPIGRIRPGKAHDFYDRLAATSVHKAAAVVRIARVLWKFALVHELVATNIWSLVQIRTPPARVRIWTPAEFAAIVAWADALDRPSIADAVTVAYYFAQREGDVLALTRLNYQDGRLRLRQSKRRAQVSLPRFPLVAARLDAAVARLEDADVRAPQLIVSEATGRGYKVDNFSHRFAEVRAAAARALPSCTTLRFQDLRDTAITTLAEAGCTIPEIASISGHSEAHVLSVLRHYLALNEAIADSAIAKLLAHYERQAEAETGTNV